MRKEFWKNIPLNKLTQKEWESLCDGCGKCCLNKFQKTKKSLPIYTSIACKFLNIKKCTCTVYKNRKKKRSDCLILSAENLEKTAKWLPQSCSYRLIFEKKELPFWHHLNNNKNKNVHNTKNSVKNFAISEEYVDSTDMSNHMAKKINNTQLIKK